MSDSKYSRFPLSVTGRTLSATDTTRLYRILLGERLSGRSLPPEFRTAAIGDLKQDLEELTRYGIQNLWNELGELAEVGDHDKYREIAVEFHGHVLFAFLVGRDRLYPNIKWNWENIQYFSESNRLADVLDICINLYTSTPWNSRIGARLLSKKSDELGISVDLSTAAWRPRRISEAKTFEWPDGFLIVSGGVATEVSAAAAAVFSLCDGASTVGDIVAVLKEEFGFSSPSRIEEDVKIALQQFRLVGLLQTGELIDEIPKMVLPEVDVTMPFDPTIKPVGDAAYHVQRQIKIWRDWLEFMSLYDDFVGTEAAGQLGAVHVAGRGMIRQVLRIRLRNLGLEPELDELGMIRIVWGPESNVFREI